MQELIKVTINKQGFKVVSAKDLYDYLEYNVAHWTRWYKKNIENNPFATEGVDWEGFTLRVSGNETKDFALTIEFAKKIAMMSRTEKGEQARNYFLECEREAKSKPKKTRQQRYIEQGKDPKWIAQRTETIDTRKYFTLTLKEHGVKDGGYRNCTNAIYNPLFGGSSVVVREKIGINKSQSIRDNLTRSQLAAVNLAEQLAAEKIERENINGNAKCEMVCTHTSKAVASAVNQALR